VTAQSHKYGFFLFSYYGHAGTFATYASLLFAARGMTPGQVGILMSLIQVMRIIGPNLWGWVADHTRQRVRVLRLTAVAATVSFAVMFVAQSFGTLFAGMVLLNLFTSAQSPISEALMLSEMKGDVSGYGKIRLWGSIGFILAVAAAGYLLEWYGVEMLPWIAGAILLAVVGGAWWIKEAPSDIQHHEPVALLPVIRKPEVIAFFAQAALMAGAHMALYAYYSLYLERAGYSKSVIGMMWSAGVVAEIFFFYYSARVFRFISPKTVILASCAIAALRFCVIGASADWLYVLAAVQVLHAITYGAHHSACVHTMQRWFAGPLQARGQALYMSLSYGIGGTVGGLSMSLCWDQFGPSAVYFQAALMALAALWVARASFRRF
jgi:PPP family 3-phenylpropionic acid transporter